MFKNIIIIPLGSIEYHGEHLPSNTDTIIAEKIAHGLKSTLEEKYSNYQISIAGSEKIGISKEHAGFNQTKTLGLLDYIDKIQTRLEALGQETLCILVNGHGGNQDTICAIESDFNYDNSRRKVIVPRIYSQKVKDYCVAELGSFDTHAGSVETSLMSHYGEIENGTNIENSVTKEMKGYLRYFKTIKLHKNGIISDNSVIHANSNIGKGIHEVMVDETYEYSKYCIDNIIRIAGDNYAG